METRLYWGVCANGYLQSLNLDHVRWLPRRPRTFTEFFPPSAFIIWGSLNIVLFFFTTHWPGPYDYLRPYTLIFDVALILLGIWLMVRIRRTRNNKEF